MITTPVAVCVVLASTFAKLFSTPFPSKLMKSWAAPVAAKSVMMSCPKAPLNENVSVAARSYQKVVAPSAGQRVVAAGADQRRTKRRGPYVACLVGLQRRKCERGSARDEAPTPISGRTHRRSADRCAPR
jgi:hypothetical protein